MGVMDDRPREPADDGVIFAALYPGLRRFAAVVGWPEHEPDDLVQEAVARALRHGPIGSLENPGAYLRTSVVRLVSNRTRGRFRRGVVHRSLAAGERPAGSTAIRRISTSCAGSMRRTVPCCSCR
jgi:DNA-directed RNA polymerase specialized sigma24 family protein